MMPQHDFQRNFMPPNLALDNDQNFLSVSPADLHGARECSSSGNAGDEVDLFLHMQYDKVTLYHADHRDATVDVHPSQSRRTTSSSSFPFASRPPAHPSDSLQPGALSVERAFPDQPSHHDLISSARASEESARAENQVLGHPISTDHADGRKETQNWNTYLQQSAEECFYQARGEKEDDVWISDVAACWTLSSSSHPRPHLTYHPHPHPHPSSASTSHVSLRSFSFPAPSDPPHQQQQQPQSPPSSSSQYHHFSPQRSASPLQISSYSSHFLDSSNSSSPTLQHQEAARRKRETALEGECDPARKKPRKSKAADEIQDSERQLPGGGSKNGGRSVDGVKNDDEEEKRARRKGSATPSQASQARLAAASPSTSTHKFAEFLRSLEGLGIVRLLSPLQLRHLRAGGGLGPAGTEGPATPPTERHCTGSAPSAGEDAEEVPAAAIVAGWEVLDVEAWHEATLTPPLASAASETTPDRKRAPKSAAGGEADASAKAASNGGPKHAFAMRLRRMGFRPWNRAPKPATSGYDFELRNPDARRHGFEFVQEMLDRYLSTKVPRLTQAGAWRRCRAAVAGCEY